MAGGIQTLGKAYVAAQGPRPSREEQYAMDAAQEAAAKQAPQAAMPAAPEQAPAPSACPNCGHDLSAAPADNSAAAAPDQQSIGQQIGNPFK